MTSNTGSPDGGDGLKRMLIARRAFGISTCCSISFSIIRCLLCAWRALLALALKRVTNASSSFLRASSFFAFASRCSSSTSRAAR